MWRLSTFLLLLLLGCERDRPPAAPSLDPGLLRDGAIYDRDPIRSRQPPRPDAGPHDAAAPDAGGGAIVVDGILDPLEWKDATTFTNDLPASGIFAGDRLDTLHVFRDETHLHIGIGAELSSGNAILVYVDADYGLDRGLVSPTQLFDTLGTLDRALSKELVVADPELRIDFGWGTTRMNHRTSDESMGWRDIATDPSSFRPLVALSACGPNACETSIPLSTLGAGDIALFVRLGSATSLALSNQTLPADSPAEPESITFFAFLPAR